MRISDWSSDVCSSDLITYAKSAIDSTSSTSCETITEVMPSERFSDWIRRISTPMLIGSWPVNGSSYMTISGSSAIARRSEEHTSELQSLMRISYAVFCLKKKTTKQINSHAYDTRRK